MHSSSSLSSGLSKNPRKEKTMQRDAYAPKQARHFWFSLLVFSAFVLLLAACGSNSSSGTGGTTPTATSAQNTTPTSSGYSRYGGGTTPTAGSSNNLIKTSTAMVSGKSETILTNAQGLTLYYNTS